MLTSFVLCIVCVFSVIGIIYTIECVIRAIREYHNKSSCIVIGVKNHADSIEGLVRTIMRGHPGSEILIIDYGSTDETNTIISKLCKDFPNIHFSLK